MQSPLALGGELRDRLQALVLGVHQRLQVRDRPVAGPLDEIEHAEHRRRPDDPPALQVPGPQAAASAIERQIDTGASSAFLPEAPAPAAGFGRV